MSAQSVATRYVNALRASGLSPEDISEALDRRVSPRTIYRWAAGKARPGSKEDLAVLERLVADKLGAVAVTAKE